MVQIRVLSGWRRSKLLEWLETELFVGYEGECYGSSQLLYAEIRSKFQGVRNHEESVRTSEAYTIVCLFPLK